MNNDVEPFEPGWLCELVACLSSSGASAVGATLLHGAARPGEVEGGYVIQHQGVRFRRREGFVTPTNYLDRLGGLERIGTDVPGPAVTAACMLIERSRFEELGGFTPGYRYGYEDVDLGLKIVAAGGTTICSGRSVLFHHESATRLAEQEVDARRHMRSRNQSVLMGRFGPQLHRQFLRDRLDGVGYWSEHARPELAIALGASPEADLAARELGDALEARGWEVGFVERVGDGWGEPAADTDVLLVTSDGCGVSLPAGVMPVAWVLGEPERWLRRPWLRRFEIVLAGDRDAQEVLSAGGRHSVLFEPDGEWDERARELSGLIRERCERLRFCLRLPHSRRPGSAHATARLATELRRQLERRDHACLVQAADEWERLDGLTTDVVVALGHDERHVCRPGQINVLWVDGAPPAEAFDEDWDLIGVGSGRLSELLGSEHRTGSLFSLAGDGDAADEVDGAVERLLGAVAVEARRIGLPTQVVPTGA
jgi:hypothetical protein